MKPDRFEILVCLSGIAVAALITTAAFGMAADKPAANAGSYSGNIAPAIFTSAPSASARNRFAEPGFIRLSRESIVFVRPGTAVR